MSALLHFRAHFTRLSAAWLIKHSASFYKSASKSCISTQQPDTRLHNTPTVLNIPTAEAVKLDHLQPPKLHEPYLGRKYQDYSEQSSSFKVNNRSKLHQIRYFLRSSRRYMRCKRRMQEIFEGKFSLFYKL
jgi:hypothetical protein